MRVLIILTMGLLFVFAFTGLQGARADQADEAYQKGLNYMKGYGVTVDYAEAMKWFKMAADQGNVEAIYNIGLMYEQGVGVELDYDMAYMWYRKAANQGSFSAMDRLRMPIKMPFKRLLRE